MELKDIISISGQPGLYKFVAQSKNGIIVEALADGKRFNASASSKVSTLTEIAVYTDTDEKPLADIFEQIFAATGGKQTVSGKAEPAELKAKFAEFIPDYDRDRVHVSDMKKLFTWYNALVAAGMTKFKEDEVTEEAAEEGVEKSAVKAAKSPAAKPVKAAVAAKPAGGGKSADKKAPPKIRTKK